MIASAMAAAPKLLLMDEPAGGLTPREIDHVIEVVENVERAASPSFSSSM